MQLSLSQLLHIGCLKKSVISTNITQLLLNFDLNYIKVLADDTGVSTNDKSDKELELDIDQFIDNILSLFITSYKHAVPGFVDGFVAGPIANKINEFVTEFMNTPVTNGNNAVKSSVIKLTDDLNMNVCPLKRKEPDYWDLNEGGSIIGFSAAFIIWLFICICIHIYLRNSKKRNEEENQRLILKVEHSSLIMSEYLPIYIRYGIPLFLLLNIALFISSNTSIGASVYLVLDIGGHELKSHTLFNFTLISSIRDMWHAGVYALALLIAVFSGIWPYVKLVAMMLCWMMPHIILSIRGREKVLMFLDAMGKWSLIDAFILVFMMVVFSFKVEVPPHLNGTNVLGTSVADSATIITTYVVPQMGFHSFVLATIASLVITHIILVFHRRVSIRELSVFATNNHLSVNKDSINSRPLNDYMHVIPADKYRDLLSVNSLCEEETNVNDIENDPIDIENDRNQSNDENVEEFKDTEVFDFDSEMELLDEMEKNEEKNAEEDEFLIIEMERSPLSANVFHINGIKLQFTFIGIIVVVISLLVSLGLLLTGGLINSFAFQFNGAAATFLEYLGVDNHKPYSLMTLAMALPASSVNPHSFSIRWIQVSFMLFAFIIPLCYIFIIFLLWVLPLHAKEQRRLFIVAEIIRAWSSMEVFVLAVITALIALQQFTQSIIGHRCDLINKLIKRFLPWIFYGGVEVCFDIKATLLPGCWLMFFSVVIYIIVGQIVMGLCHKVIQERDKLYKAYQKRTRKGCGCSTGCMKEYYGVFIDYLVWFFTKCKVLEIK